MIYKYTFTTGESYITKLNKKEFIKRLNRLNTLRVLTEQYDCQEGIRITNKCWKAYKKRDNFTGIIHLTFNEKDWLSYMLENEFLDDDDIQTIMFYINLK